MNGKYCSILLLAMILISGCDKLSKSHSIAKGGEQMAIKITRPAFEESGMIPSNFAYSAD